VIGGVFFVIPIYLQYVLLKNAFETGIKLAPMSIAMLIAAFTGPVLARRMSPRLIVSSGLILVIVGALILVSTVDPELRDAMFGVGMAVFGAGFGLVASQLGNVIMSSVGDRDRGEAGGLQGTAQNIGMSIGVAMIGAILIGALSAGFNDAAQTDPDISAQTKAVIAEATEDGVEIAARDQLDEIAVANGIPAGEVSSLAQAYVDAQIMAIKASLLLAIAFAILGLLIAQRLPRIPGVELGATDDAVTEAPPAPA
jgi:Na+/melibiose symporter-like transporter